MKRVECAGGDGLRVCQCSGNVHECKCVFKEGREQCSECRSLKRDPYREFMIKEPVAG